MKIKHTLTLICLLALLASSALSFNTAPAAALDDPPEPTPAGEGQDEGRPLPWLGDGPLVTFASRSDSYGPLWYTDPPPPTWLGLISLPRKMLPNRPGDPGDPTGGPIQGGFTGASAASIGASFEGINNVNGYLPPDTQGDVGPNHYVQVVNSSFAIWDRTGTLLHGPADINTLFSGFGGACENTNDGDPIVLYDHLADRWLLSQFALPNYPSGPFYQCIVVSQGADPTGSWHRYEFLWSSTKLNDYPKFGVWEDGYYMAVNQFAADSLNWAGQGVAVFERDQMLTGGLARMIQFDLYSTNSNLGGMLPSDLDGPAPPAGTPNTFIEVDDAAWGGVASDRLQIFEFHTDWVTPANSTFTSAGFLNTASFDSDMCGGTRNCIPQPGGRDLDAISDRLMYRLQFRDFGDYQTLVTNHTVDVNGSDHAGVRWYELRDSGSGWSIYQQSTFAPDSDHRWMASVAMNNRGEIALGYSVSSTSVNPSIRFTGRMAGDPLNQMTQGEAEIIAGTGYQDHSDGRWGDYSMMSVDPVDDCTFWYTQEYYATSGFFNTAWQTRIASFQLTDCDATTSTLSFVPGWNLISLPLLPTDPYQAQSLLDDINAGGGDCSEIDRWLNDTWDAHIDGLTFNNYDIQVGQGYFIKCSQSSDWILEGSALESGVALDLIPGWNLVGVPYPESGYNAQGVLDDINAQGGECSEIDRWLDDTWDAHIDGLTFNNFDLLPDEGYFVKCTETSSFTPSSQ